MTDILQGDCMDVLPTLPADHFHCVVTSPPYFALRSYLKSDHPLKAQEIGSEPTPEEFIETMVRVFREVRRVMHPSGLLFLNLSDTMASEAGQSMMELRSDLTPTEVAFVLQELADNTPPSTHGES